VLTAFDSCSQRTTGSRSPAVGVVEVPDELARRMLPFIVPACTGRFSVSVLIARRANTFTRVFLQEILAVVGQARTTAWAALGRLCL